MSKIKKFISKNYKLFLIGIIFLCLTPKIFEGFELKDLDDITFKKIMNGIESVVVSNGTFITFKKETSFDNFDVVIFYDLVQRRKKKKQKLEISDIKLVFAETSKEKIIDSVRIVEAFGETAGECSRLMDNLTELLDKKDVQHKEAVTEWERKKGELTAVWNSGLIVDNGAIEWQGAQKSCEYINAHCRDTDIWRRKCMCKGWIASSKDGGWDHSPPGSNYRACNTGGWFGDGGIYGERYHWTRNDFARCPGGHSDPNHFGYAPGTQGCSWGLNDINCKQAFPELYTPQKDNRLSATHNKTGYSSVYALAVARNGPPPTKDPIDIASFVCNDCRQYQDKLNVADSKEVNIQQISNCIANIGNKEAPVPVPSPQPSPIIGGNDIPKREKSDVDDKGDNKNLIIGLSVAGAIVLLLGVGISIFMATRTSRTNRI